MHRVIWLFLAAACLAGPAAAQSDEAVRGNPAVIALYGDLNREQREHFKMLARRAPGEPKALRALQDNYCDDCTVARRPLNDGSGGSYVLVRRPNTPQFELDSPLTAPAPRPPAGPRCTGTKRVDPATGQCVGS